MISKNIYFMLTLYCHLQVHSTLFSPHLAEKASTFWNFLDHFCRWKGTEGPS
jgi:hypothetical protein